jgi:sugar-specific transcriptional regulator TrmB
MNPPREHVSTLVELGLSKSQAKVYLALFKSNNPNARTISTISGISRPDVYRVLGTLKDAGLVEKIISKPEKFHALSIGELVSTLLERRKRTTEKLHNKAIRLAQNLEMKQPTEEVEHGRYCLSSGLKPVTRYYLRDLTETQKSKDCVLDRKRLLFVINRYFEHMKEVAKKGVKIRFITNIPEDKEFAQIIQTLNEVDFCELKFTLKVPRAGIDIFDRRVVHFISSSSDFENPEVLRVTNADIVDLAQDFFELKWRSAQTIT